MRWFVGFLPLAARRACEPPAPQGADAVGVRGGGKAAARRDHGEGRRGAPQRGLVRPHVPLLRAERRAARTSGPRGAVRRRGMQRAVPVRERSANAH